MKKFVCSKVRFIEDRYVTSIADGVATLTEGKVWTVINFNNASLTEDFSKSFAGKQITQVLHVDGELDTVIANRLMLPLIFELTLSDGRTMLWGDKQIRCKVKSGTLQIAQGAISFERKTTAFQF